jgi:cytochrome-b5 reductase
MMVTDLEAASSLGLSGLSHRNTTGESNTGAPVRKSCWGCQTCKDCLSSENASQLVPYTEFTQNDSYIFLKVVSRGMRRNKDYWTVGILNREILLLKLITKPPDMWIAHFRLTDQLQDDTVELSFTNRYKNMTLKLRKPRAIQWKRLGEPLQEHNEIEDSRAIVEDMHQGTILINEPVASNLNFIAIQLPPSAVLGVPVGWDVKVRHTGTARRYTPVYNFLQKKTDTEKMDKKGELIFLVYRVYPDGQMTPKLRDLEIGDNTSLQVGSSAGNFDTTWLQGGDAIFLLAAGSGITPFFRVIEFIVKHNIALGLSHVVLIYWDRREKELVWKKGFEKLEEKHFWFQFIPIITTTAGGWTGLQGRVCPDLLQTCMDSVRGLTSDKKRIRFMSCGSDGYNTAVFKTIETLGFHSSNLFTFLG